MSPQSCAQVTRRTWMLPARGVDPPTSIAIRDVVLVLLVAHVRHAATDEEVALLRAGIGWRSRIPRGNAEVARRYRLDCARSR